MAFPKGTMSEASKKYWDDQNRTGKPISVRPDLDKELNETQQDVYIVELNDSSEGGNGRGALPTEKYPSGSVPHKTWNKSRPHRQVRAVVARNRDHRNAID